MTWVEFMLRLDGHNRKNKEQWRQVRHISYMVYQTIYEKHPKMSIEKFLPIDGDNGESKTRVSAWGMEMLKMEIEKAQDGRFENRDRGGTIPV